MRRMIPALGCALALGACTSWAQAPAPAPAALHEFEGPVEVVRHDRFSLLLHDAYVKGDTLYGDRAGTRMAVALRDVKAIRRQKVEPLQTAGAVVGATVAAFAALVAVAVAAGWEIL
ncbi:MAG TPA: hypothetical protein VFS20_19635 [Longimicrobium sp.]|nr:hypothetical protein [Longimicrobium sp.]